MFIFTMQEFVQSRFTKINATCDVLKLYIKSLKTWLLIYNNFFKDYKKIIHNSLMYKLLEFFFALGVL